MVLGTMGSHRGVFGDLEAFVTAHLKCDTLSGGAGDPASDGYLLSVTCSCGAVFDRWVTPEAAEHDLIWSSLSTFSS